MITTVLLDLDGVIRHFDPAHVIAVEERHGIAPGTLQATAFAPERVDPAIAGRISRSEWTRQIGEAVDNHVAATEWLAHRGEIDWDLVAVVDDLRAQGITVAVLTNGTDTVADEVYDHGLTHHFDAIFSSSEIGFAKPDPRAFSHVCDALGVEPQNVFFTDDTPSKLRGASDLGMMTTHYIGIDDFRSRIGDLGLVA